ncbi:MAG: hypothetical protein ACRDV4_00110, partial [Acidimicrobiales bacterium]
TRALWIPAGVRHETLSTSSATMQAVYVRPDLCPIAWSDCTPVAAGALLRELIAYLSDPGLEASACSRAEALVVDLLRPVVMATIDVAIPHEERAREGAAGTLPPTAGPSKNGDARSAPANARWPVRPSPTRDFRSAAGRPGFA